MEEFGVYFGGELIKCIDEFYLGLEEKNQGCFGYLPELLGG